jgi:hypothetical protein
MVKAKVEMEIVEETLKTLQTMPKVTTEEEK